jgi:hypothetical protein
VLRPRLQQLNWGREKRHNQEVSSPVYAAKYHVFANQDETLKKIHEHMMLIAVLYGVTLDEMEKFCNNMVSFRIGNLKSVVINDVLLDGHNISPLEPS